MDPKNKEVDEDFPFDEEPGSWMNTIMVICFVLPWVLGLGVIGIFIIELLDL